MIEGTFLGPHDMRESGYAIYTEGVLPLKTATISIRLLLA